LGDIERVDGYQNSAHHPFNGWDGIVPDSFFSGILFRWVTRQSHPHLDLPDYEYVIVGRYCS